MTQKAPKSDHPLDESGPKGDSGRRKFLKSSLGAAPVVLTIGNRSGWGGGSMHGTLWSSAGGNWRDHGDKWWRKGGWKDWETPKPPHWSDRDGGKSHKSGGGHDDSHGKEWDFKGDRESFGSREHQDAESRWNWDGAKDHFASSDERPVGPIEPSKKTGH